MLNRHPINFRTLSCVLLIYVHLLYAHAQAEIRDDLVKSIEYRYELFINKSDKQDCKGTLAIALNKPGNVQTIIVDRTKPHTTDTEHLFYFYSKSIHTSDVDTIIKTDVLWGTYFRVSYVMEDNSSVSSPIYCVDDYIDPDDMALIKGLTDIYELAPESPVISVKGKIITIDTQKQLHLSVYDAFGRTIISKRIAGHTEIPLEHISSPYIIVTYTLDNHLITKKFLIQ